jgi:peptidoglycan-associated lipoprotein
MVQLEKDAAYLKQNMNVQFTVEGHADERGNQEYNLALGERRANSVKQFLTSQGIADSRIHIQSYGKERPACTLANPDEACHQKNRRAAFTAR